MEDYLLALACIAGTFGVAWLALRVSIAIAAVYVEANNQSRYKQRVKEMMGP